MFNVGIALCQDRFSESPLEAENSEDRSEGKYSYAVAVAFLGTNRLDSESGTWTCWSQSCRWCTATAWTAC